MKNVDAYFQETYDLDKAYVCHMQKYYFDGVVTPAHVHDFAEAIYGIDCDYLIYSDDKIYNFKDGDLMFFFSNQVHKIESLRNGKSKHICLRFNPGVVTDVNSSVMIKYMIPFMLKEKKNKCYFSSEELKGSGVSEAMWKMYKETENNGYGYEIAMKMYLQQLGLFLLRQWDSDKDLNINTLDETRMIDVFKYIEDNYQEEISVTEMAKKYYVSSSYFSRWFKKVTGKTFKQYVNSVRINRATELLINSDYNITEVSMMTGFPTTSYFIKQFKLLKGGCSPKKFKTTYR